MNLPDFLVSSSKAVFLYKDNQFKEVSIGDGIWYGLTKYPEGFIFLTRKNLNGTDGGNPNATNTLEFYDKEFKLTGHNSNIDTRDGHQILCIGNVLYVCNSGKNTITYIGRLGYGNHICLYPSEVGLDVHHMNSISFYDDKFYICQHRTKFGLDNGGVSVWGKGWNFIEHIEIGTHAHNAQIKDGFLWSCDSENGVIVKINLDTKERQEYSVSHDCMTRGLAINENFLLVGLSERDTRERRHFNKTGRIVIYSYPDMKFFHELKLDGVGQINDILLV